MCIYSARADNKYATSLQASHCVVSQPTVVAYVYTCQLAGRIKFWINSINNRCLCRTQSPCPPRMICARKFRAQADIKFALGTTDRFACENQFNAFDWLLSRRIIDGMRWSARTRTKRASNTLTHKNINYMMPIGHDYSSIKYVHDAIVCAIVCRRWGRIDFYTKNDVNVFAQIYYRK